MATEQPSRIGRRLSAILAADAAGYSRLMGLDEVGTASALRKYRTIIDALVARHGGRIVKTTGDGLLAEFPSVVDAVECALAFQTAVAEINDSIAQDRRMLFRIGINLGDILIEGDDILGDGVNIAARLEGIAEPGGICISSSAYDQVRGKIAVEFNDLGEQNLKNIARPVRVYTVLSGVSQPEPTDGSAKPSPPPMPRLSVVVLPFTNIGGDPEQDYFADGVTESLTTDLSRIRGSFVIARNTAFTFKRKAVDVKQVGRELNVRYVLEGSVQRAGSRMRVNVQLIDAQTGHHLWAERFDKPVADLFDMQDEIVSRLANTLNIELLAAEARRAERSPDPDSMDLYFQGMACANKGITTDRMARARNFFERALALDPANTEALVGIARVDAAIAGPFMTDSRAAQFAAAEAVIVKVLSGTPQHATAHMLLGSIHISTKQALQGIAECEQALALDRNLAEAHGWIGLAKYQIGRAKETEAHIHEALRLSPRDIKASSWAHFVGLSKLQLGEYEEAIAWSRRSIEANRNFPLSHFALAASLALLGELDRARTSAEAGRSLDPNFTIRRLRDNPSSNDPTYLSGRERFYEGLRIAGVPEK